MFCSDCPLRTRCTSVCDALEVELQKLEAPLIGIATSPNQLDEIITDQEKAKFFGSCGDEKSHDHDESVEKSPNFDVLYKAMETLTFQQKEILHLRFWEDLTPSQIAEKAGVSRQHVHRALRKSFIVIRNEYLNQDLNCR